MRRDEYYGFTSTYSLMRKLETQAEYERHCSELRRRTIEMEDKKAKIAANAIPTHKGEVMEVGKIITKEAYRSSYSKQNEENVSVDMSQSGIVLKAQSDREGRESLLPHGGLALTAAQALELGQFLLKAAELQPEYAEAHQRLLDEAKKLDDRYKDMISGLGVSDDLEVDVLDARGTFTVVDAGNVLEA